MQNSSKQLCMQTFQVIQKVICLTAQRIRAAMPHNVAIKPFFQWRVSNISCAWEEACALMILYVLIFLFLSVTLGEIL